MRQPPPRKKSGVRLPLAFSTIPFEAPPAEEQAHRLRLVLFGGKVKEMMLDFVFFFIFFFEARAAQERAHLLCL